MSCADPWVIEQRMKDAAKEEAKEEYESTFAGIQEMPEGSLMQDDKILKYNGDNEWALVSPTPIFNEKKEWVHMVPPAPIGGYEDCSEIYVNGKSYLMIDNSGSEELNPHNLQEEIVELHKELDDAYSRIRLHDYPVGQSAQPVSTFEEAEKIIESNLMTFGEMADSVVHGSYSGCGYVAAEGYSFSGYGTPTPQFDLTSISLVSDPEAGCEIKLVSAEEADYERAMSMVGK